MDRLCYTADPEAEGARFLPLDRIPVRALPRGYGPKLGVTLIEDRQVGRLGLVIACLSASALHAAPTSTPRSNHLAPGGSLRAAVQPQEGRLCIQRGVR